ncbi:snapalysin family zinc-dependent metalloprotease [Amycolatopsis nigrescens]|uniref:snapalysin family zinc-dependent metalloprotease n=1 Tax=Amycolatopsis nigrescens TaxID=381445 RepID=UPI00037341DA|nr:snapalysin family zinc-dependent metalloprotease [Amycolatopsis nigrescens]
MLAKTRRTLLAVFAFLLALLVAGPAASAQDAHIQVRTVYYNSNGAAEFKDAVDAGAKVWNDTVKNVKLVKGSPSTVTIVADNGWPRAQPRGLGAGTIWMGRQAVNEGHDTIRIAAHELGHIFGLPDRRTGLCEDLMSGASAGTSCKNPKPNAAEAAEVERNFANGFSTQVTPGVLLTEEPLSVR